MLTQPDIDYGFTQDDVEELMDSFDYAMYNLQDKEQHDV